MRRRLPVQQAGVRDSVGGEELVRPHPVRAGAAPARPEVTSLARPVLQQSTCRNMKSMVRW